MEIIQLDKSYFPQMVEIFKKAYATVGAPDSEVEYFKEEVSTAFSTGTWPNIIFFGIEEDEQLVSFAGLEELYSCDGAWVLRWGTTLPEHQGKGLMSALIKHRIAYAQQARPNFAGIISVGARHPSIYKPFGFIPLYKRGPENSLTYMYKLVNEHLDCLEKV
jgi:GNAT superfamily N-acetyltransferase